MQTLISKEFIGWIFESIFLHLHQMALLLRVVVSYDGLCIPPGRSFSEKQCDYDDNHDDQGTATQTNNSSKHCTRFEWVFSWFAMVMIVVTHARLIFSGRSRIMFILRTSFLLVQTKCTVMCKILNSWSFSGCRWWWLGGLCKLYERINLLALTITVDIRIFKKI